MLNGWTMKLRSAQVRMTSPRKKRARLHALSGLSSLADRRREEREAIRPAVWRARARGQAGVAFGRRAAMCAAMAERQQQPAAKTLTQLFEAGPDRLSRLTFETAGIYFDWAKTHLDQAYIEQSME